MNPYRWKILIALVMGIGAVAGATQLPGLQSPRLAQAQDAQPDKQAAQGGEKDDVIGPIEQLAKAYNTRDAKLYAEVWTEGAEYLDENTGERLEGRKAIVADFKGGLDKNEQVRLEIDIAKVRRLGGNAAAIEGTTSILRAKAPVAHSRFLALVVRIDGKWLIDNIRESLLENENVSGDFLEALNWLNGTWNHQEGDRDVTWECGYVANGNFQSVRFQVKTKGEIIYEGTKILGWDPLKKQLRSWTFASDGSFADGVIESDQDRWTFRVTGVLPDGEKSSATQIITRKGPNTFTFQAIDRSVGTRPLPNGPEIELTRVVAKSTKEE